MSLKPEIVQTKTEELQIRAVVQSRQEIPRQSDSLILEQLEMGDGTALAHFYGELYLMRSVLFSGVIDTEIFLLSADEKDQYKVKPQESAWKVAGKDPLTQNEAEVVVLRDVNEKFWAIYTHELTPHR